MVVKADGGLGSKWYLLMEAIRRGGNVVDQLYWQTEVTQLNRAIPKMYFHYNQ